MRLNTKRQKKRNIGKFNSMTVERRAMYLSANTIRKQIALTFADTHTHQIHVYRAIYLHV